MLEQKGHRVPPELILTRSKVELNPDVLTMSGLQITLPGEEKIQDVLFGDRGVAVFMESVLNQVLQSERPWCSR